MHEGRVPRTLTLSVFYSCFDAERGWLNEHVIPRFCPRRMPLVVSLDGSSDEEAEEDDDDDDISVKYLPRNKEDSEEWVPVDGKGEGDPSEEDSESDECESGSDSEESATTDASEESDSDGE